MQCESELLEAERVNLSVQQSMVAAGTQAAQQSDPTTPCDEYAYKCSLKGLPKRVALTHFTHKVYKDILHNTSEDQRKIDCKYIRHNKRLQTMVTLEQSKTPTSLKDSKRFYINAYYSVGYGHPLAYRLGYKTGDVLGYKGGFVEGLKNKIGPFDPRTLRQDSSQESEVYEQTSDEDKSGIISRHVQDSLLYTSNTSGSSSDEDSDHSLKGALISLYNSTSDNSSAESDQESTDDEQW